MIRNTKLMSDSMKEVRVRESHDCEKIHPKMNHLEWVAQNKDAQDQDKDPVGPQHEEILVEDMSLAPKGKGRKAAKALYKEDEKEETEWQKSKRQDREAQKSSEKQHDDREARYQRQKAGAKSIIKKGVRKIVTARGTFYAKEDVGVEEGAGFTGGVRPEKPPHMRPGQTWKKIALIKKELELKKAKQAKEEVETEVYKPNYGQRPFEPKNPKPHPAGITGPHNYPVNGDEKKKERDALVKAVAKSPKQRALKKKQDAAKKEEVVHEQLPVGHRSPSPGSDSTGSYAKMQDAKRKAKAAGDKEDNWQKYHEEVEESNLPPHLAKFFDKKGNLKPDAAKRMAAGKVKRKSKDVTPKGYGPNEEVEIDEKSWSNKQARAEVTPRRGGGEFEGKRGNTKPSSAHQMERGKKKVPGKKAERFPMRSSGPKKLSGPQGKLPEEVEVEETVGLGGWKGSGIAKMPPVDKKTGKYVTGKTKIIRITKKGEKALKKGDQKLSITAKGRAAVEEVEVDIVEVLPGFQKKKGTPNLDASRAARRAKKEKDNPKNFRKPHERSFEKKPGWDRFPEEVEQVDEIIGAVARGAAIGAGAVGKGLVKVGVPVAKVAGKLAFKGAKAGGRLAGRLAVKGAKAAAPHIKRGAVKVGKEVGRISKEVGKEVVSRAAVKGEKIAKAGGRLAVKGAKGVSKIGSKTTTDHYGGGRPSRKIEEVEFDEQEMMQLKHKKSGQIMRVANKVYQKQAHIQRKRGWVPDTKQPHMRGGSAIQHSYEPEGDTELQEMDFKVKIKGLPIFYVPGRSVGEIRAHMRKNLKRPQDVEWVERTTVAQKKKDFRLRAQDKDSG